MPMSRSRSASRQKEIAAARATSPSEAATCQRATWIEVLIERVVRYGCRTTKRNGRWPRSRQDLRQRAPADQAAALGPQHPVAEPPGLLGVVADEDDRDLQLAPQLRQGSL